MIYKYKEYVQIRSVCKDDINDCRFLAEYKLDNGDKDKKALVIMKNPSKADDNISDQTINTVLDYMHIFNYSKVYVMNLIPIYGLDSRITILTTEANESMQNIHDRMPLIMEQRELETWLYDDSSVEFLLHKKQGGLSIALGGVQQTLDLL